MVETPGVEPGSLPLLTSSATRLFHFNFDIIGNEQPVCLRLTTG